MPRKTCDANPLCLLIDDSYTEVRSMGRLDILIADDSEFMRIAYKRILESQSDLRVVAMASNGEEAVRMAEKTAPDVAILDVWMPKVDGIRAAHEIRKLNPETAIVVISSYDDLALVADLMQNGVERKAYLLKHSISDVTDLVRIVESVYRGHTVLDSSIVQRMASLFCKHSAKLETDLNETEQDVLGLMAEGYDDRRIGETLHLREMQLAEYSASLLEKLGIAERTPAERRISAIQTFVAQIHKVPLSRAYDAVG